jgi:glycosyltransferase involved in cell wall biosynthesis
VSLSYAPVTPARDEVDNLARLAASFAKQTVLPARWVIVDDDSQDGTLELARELECEHDWITVLSVAGADRPALDRRAGCDVRAFHTGIGSLDQPYDIVLKVDADVSFAPDFFERLLAAFEADPSLGIASGSCYEQRPDEWEQRHVTAGHVWGATRAYRRRCLEDVLPLEERLGWDGIDEMKASERGWTTRTLVDLPFYHHRREGDREGSRLRAWAPQGESAHFMGYRALYLALRSFHHARRDPAALAMLWGYAAAAARREPRCEDVAVRSYLRRHQSVRNLPLRMREALGRRAA